MRLLRPLKSWDETLTRTPPRYLLALLVIAAGVIMPLFTGSTFNGPLDTLTAGREDPSSRVNLRSLGADLQDRFNEAKDMARAPTSFSNS